jgi:hypothetical protein
MIEFWWLYKKRERDKSRHTYTFCMPCDTLHYLGTLPIRRPSLDVAP